MDILQISAGALVIALVLVDAVRTTISVGTGTGPLTGLVTKNLWEVALAIHRRRPSHQMLQAFGVGLLLLSVGMWVLLMIVGWTLVFTGGRDAVVASSDGAPADLVGRIWFTSYTVFSLGNGEYRPEGDVWQLVAVLAIGTGLSLVTLGISYLVPVVSAVVERRRLALHIATLGRTPFEVATFAIDHPMGFLQHAGQLVTEIGMVTQQHLAYPVLHYFHATGPASSAAVAVTVLDEAMTMLELGVEDLPAEVGGGMRPLQASIRQLLLTLQGAFIRETVDAPPPPDLERLRPSSLRLVDQATYVARVREQDAHRCLLYGMLRDDGWDLAALQQPLELDRLR